MTNRPPSRLSFIATDELNDDNQFHTMGFTWLMWADQTSFYLTARLTAFGELKVSLHGPHGDPAKTPVNKLGFDSSFVAKDGAEYGGLMLGEGMRFPITFLGRQVVDDVRHLVRFNYSAEMFTPEVPNGGPLTLSKSTRRAGGDHVHLTVPGDGGLYFDVYVADAGAAPYFGEDPEVTRAANASAGPLVNDAGQTLTAISRHVDNPHAGDPTWQEVTDEQVEEISRQGVARSLAMMVDPDGLLWITEKLGPADFGPDSDDLFVGQYRPSRITEDGTDRDTSPENVPH